MTASIDVTEPSTPWVTSADNYLEDFVVGDRYEHSRGRTITELDNYLVTLLALNTSHVPVDATAVDGDLEGVFEARAVSGWAITSFVFGITTEDFAENAVADVGFDDINVHAPVYHGDSLRVVSEILEVTDHDQREDVGLLTYGVRAVNQHDRLVYSGSRSVLVKRRAHVGDQEHDGRR